MQQHGYNLTLSSEVSKLYAQRLGANCYGQWKKSELRSQRLQREAFFTEGEIKKFDRSFIKVPGELLCSARV